MFTFYVFNSMDMQYGYAVLIKYVYILYTAIVKLKYNCKEIQMKLYHFNL